MRFAIYSGVGEQSIRENLGRPDYSYYFVLKSFLPALERIGPITYVGDPTVDLDPIFAECAARGESCLFISFSPPHKAFIDHAHPMMVVFAWEFSTIPDEIWDGDPRNDWRTVFARSGRAVSLSSHTARIVEAAMGPDFPVAAIPGVVWDRFGRARAAGLRPPVIVSTELRLEGLVLDSRTLDLSPDYLLRAEPPIPEPPAPPAAEIGPEIPAVVERVPEPEPITIAEPEPPAPEPEPEPIMAAPEAEKPPAPPPRKTFRYRLGMTKHHALEWYRDVIRDLLPRWLVWIVSRIGRLSYRLERLLLGARPVPAPEPTIIDPVPLAVPDPEPLVELVAVEPIAVVEEAPVDSEPVESEVYNVDVAEADTPETEVAPAPSPRWPQTQVTVDGVVYTAVLNPTDGRKNLWDLITGFCWAFRDKEDATLILKMVNGDLARWYRPYIQMLSQLSPFRCRVIALHGYLEEAEYQKLIAATSYYVNVSGCEGLCLPLMEFMSCGKPAIAPCHTAMEDYIATENAFTPDFWVEHNVWPHDTRNLFRTERMRLDWESVRDAYLESYRVAKEEPSRYRAMGETAERTMRGYCSEEVVTARLRTFLGSTQAQETPTMPAANDLGEGEADKVAAL